MPLEVNRPVSTPLLPTITPPSPSSATPANAYPSAPITDSKPDYFLGSTTPPSFLPPRFAQKTHPRSRLEPFADALLTCLLVLTWPLKKLKHAILWLGNRQKRSDALRTELDKARQTLAAAHIRKDVEAQVQKLRKSENDLRTTTQHLRQQLANLAPEVQQSRHEAKNLTDLSAQVATAAAQLASTKNALSEAEQSVRSTEAENRRLNVFNAQARNDAPSLAQQNGALQTELAAVKNELETTKHALAEFTDGAKQRMLEGQFLRRLNTTRELAYKVESLATYIMQSELSRPPCKHSPSHTGMVSLLGQLRDQLRYLQNQ